MIAFIIAEAQLFLLPLDVIDARENTNIDMLVFWQIVYMSSLFMNTLVIPSLYFFFNTDEDLDHVSTCLNKNSHQKHLLENEVLHSIQE